VERLSRPVHARKFLASRHFSTVRSDLWQSVSVFRPVRLRIRSAETTSCKPFPDKVRPVPGRNGSALRGERPVLMADVGVTYREAAPVVLDVIAAIE
jgi:hypothetical protein